MSEDIKSLSQIKRIQATSPQEILNLVIGLANANKTICSLESALDVAVKALGEFPTQNKITRCPECGTTAPSTWTERSPDGNSLCSACGKASANYFWIKIEWMPHPALAEIKRLIAGETGGEGER